MTTLEFEVCNLDGSFLARFKQGEGKFVVRQSQNGNGPELSLHCLDVQKMLREKIGAKVTGKPEEGMNTAHYIVAGHYGVSREQIIGGGYYNLDQGILTVDRDSVEFGPIPEPLASIAAEKIAESIRGKGKPINEVHVAVSQNFHNERNRLRWQELGYSIP